MPHFEPVNDNWVLRASFTDNTEAFFLFNNVRYEF